MDVLEEINIKGFVEEEVDPTLDLYDEIEKLKKQKNDDEPERPLAPCSAPLALDDVDEELHRLCGVALLVPGDLGEARHARVPHVVVRGDVVVDCRRVRVHALGPERAGRDDEDTDSERSELAGIGLSDGCRTKRVVSFSGRRAGTGRGALTMYGGFRSGVEAGGLTGRQCCK